MTNHCCIISRLFASIKQTASEETSVSMRSIQSETMITQAKAFIKEIYTYLKQISQIIFDNISIFLPHGCR